jgi:hypothetical protein
MQIPSIENIHRNKTGKVSDKWESYLSVYEDIFSRWRDKKINLLEVGIQNGGSLETWATYFCNANLLVGCDIDERCSGLRYEQGHIRIVVGDVNNSNTFQKILAIANDFDIVIDDGSHKSNDILETFFRYFQFVKPGGLYVIEDTHTLYRNEYGGGLLNEFSAYNFFKKCIDLINYQFWSNEISSDIFFRTFFPIGLMPQFIKDGWIEGVEFRNSMIIVRKANEPTHEKLGERIISGQVAAVNDSILRFKNQN